MSSATSTEGLQPWQFFVLAALVPWQLFAYALTQSSNSLVAEQRLITKVYFPRLIVPVASVLAGLVDFLVALGLLLLLMAGYQVAPGWGIIAAPLFGLFAVVTALAVGLWLSALNVQYRDVRYTIPFLTQFWMFATPVAYPATDWRATSRLPFHGHPHPSLHQHPRAAAHDGLGHRPFAVHQLRLRAHP